EHGAEEADERRVVAERAEDEEPLLVLETASVDGRLHGLFHRFLPAGCDAGSGADHFGFHRIADRERRGAGEIAALATLQELGKGLRHPAAAEVERPLDHHRDRQDRQSEQEPEHPPRAEQREGEQFLGDHFPASGRSNAPTAFATRSAAICTASRCCSAVDSLWNSADSASETSTCEAVPAANCARTSRSFSREAESACSASSRSARADSRSSWARRSSSSMRAASPRVCARA